MRATLPMVPALATDLTVGVAESIAVTERICAVLVPQTMERAGSPKPSVTHATSLQPVLGTRP